MQAAPIRIGTRGSPLALAQAREVQARLAALHRLPDGAVEIRVIKTTGDRIQDRPLSEAGGKGLFTKEIEEALLAGEVDLGVHSMKDVQTVLPDRLGIVATLPREDVRDAFISLRYGSLTYLPQGAVVGTSSLRRAAQVRHARPDVKVVEFRGNVETRLRKLEDGVAEATFLACAGLNRLGLAHRITSPIPVETMLPAVAQGAVGIEIRLDDERTAGLVAPLNHEPTMLTVTAERAFLARLEGSCRTPMAGLATLESGVLSFRGEFLTPDGRHALRGARQGRPAAAAALGESAADDILAQGAREFLARST